MCRFIREHIMHMHDRYTKLRDYYDGNHKILSREKRSELSNNKLVCNHAKYITDTAVGYFMGDPVKYSGSDGDIEPLIELLKKIDSDTQDIDLGLKGSIFGVSYEFIYINGEGLPKLYSPDPRRCFVIYDDTVEEQPIAGVYYYPLYDSLTNAHKGYSVYVADAVSVRRFRADTGFTPDAEIIEEPHGMGGVPIIEIYNNSGCTGDFEPVISLIDAYNILQSDRVNDKQQFVDAILLLKGTVLGDTDKERSEAYTFLKKNGLLEVSADAGAEWLTRQFDESSVEILRRSLEQDIHKFANVPCMSDESFAGNASGVAMRYKLLGFEQLTKIKERYFREGLKERVKLLCSFLKFTQNVAINPASVTITFTRALPVNEVEKAQVVSELREMVPADILLGQLPFVDDAAGAAEQMKKEQAALMYPNTPPPDEDDDEQ